ncbi:hypothetical protein J1N35_039680 [Gossypium stocksii]|uniref:Uncharacterized protein n=1 Tax=Gossypium stocksii TaxID=47602 RepID=A0A9D3UC77_9ROSI|nr:hypothetical protein J1N35_039680 [Gossypium stocksii]
MSKIVLIQLDQNRQQELDWEQYLVEGVRTDEAIVLDLSGLRDDGGVSGRGKRWKIKLCRRGHRVTMDGTYDIKISTINGQSVCMFGIFDRHFGARAAKYLKLHLFDNLMKHPQLMPNTKLAISMLDISNDISWIWNDLLIEMMVQLLLQQWWLKKIEDAGGLINDSTRIVCSIISITHAFDNRMVKKYDIAIDEELELLMLKAIALAQAEEAETTAKRLTDIAFTRMEQKITFSWNFQCIVIKFQHPESA